MVNKAITDFWRLCNGKRKVTELVDLFAQQTGLQRSQVEKEVMQLLRQLNEGGSTSYSKSNRFTKRGFQKIKLIIIKI